MKEWRWEIMAKIIIQNDFRAGVEIGVADGRFSKWVTDNCPNLEALYCIDHYPTGYERYNKTRYTEDEQTMFRAKFLRVAEERRKIKIIENPSALAVKMFGYIDFAFIDADHSYEGCANDIELWYDKIKPGGVIAGHDYNEKLFPGVVRAVDEFFSIIGGVDLHDDYVWTYVKP